MITKKKVTKAKNGKSFPDLNKDGKITKADILKGRGVIAKKGASIKKAQVGGSFGDIYTGPAKTNPGFLKVKSDKAKADSSLKKYKAKSDSVKLEAIKKVKAKAKSGVKMGKCKYGCN